MKTSLTIAIYTSPRNDALPVEIQLPDTFHGKNEIISALAWSTPVPQLRHVVCASEKLADVLSAARRALAA